MNCQLYNSIIQAAGCSRQCIIIPLDKKVPPGHEARWYVLCFYIIRDLRPNVLPTIMSFANQRSLTCSSRPVADLHCSSSMAGQTGRVSSVNWSADLDLDAGWSESSGIRPRDVFEQVGRTFLGVACFTRSGELSVESIEAFQSALWTCLRTCSLLLLNKLCRCILIEQCWIVTRRPTNLTCIRRKQRHYSHAGCRACERHLQISAFRVAEPHFCAAA
jgi:hypothetical protein